MERGTGREIKGTQTCYLCYDPVRSSPDGWLHADFTLTAEIDSWSHMC